jgi:hypothetical protein
MKLQKATARTTALALYLQKFRQIIGPERYLNSIIRREHGTGTGLFGVSNTGSRDCLKESIRGITDALSLSYRTPDALPFRTESCIGIKVFDRNSHRIEHTIEVIELYHEFEAHFILNDQEIDLSDVGKWIIENQVTTLIEQHEQRRKGHYTSEQPFSKYSRPVLYNLQKDVSTISREELRMLTCKHFSEQLSSFLTINGQPFLDTAIASFDGSGSKAHTLPLLDVAVEYNDEEFELLTRHYKYKLSKRLDPNSRWFSANDAARYRAWQMSAL